MEFGFRDDGGQSAPVLAPLTKERIQDALRAEDWVFNVDSDGDIGGLWDSNAFYFFVYGEQQEILQIRGRWHQDLPIELRQQVREALDEWHFAKIWPKGYTTVDDSGRVWVLAEHSVDWEHGVSDEQLRLTLRCAITTALSLFKKLQERFVTVSPKELGPS
ncbi:MAG: YbjN domain-containing protein [Bifidobacteriaceae bacterium]|nr:YbjN domain-containing protein [Bifidobacteriaceae bacterium]